MAIKFGTGGFRGVVGEDFNEQNVSLIAQAISNIIIRENLSKLIPVGFDHRLLSPEYSKIISTVLASNGIKVILFKTPTPTPTVMFATEEMGCDFGIMLTASHNPYNFNGVKVFTKGGFDADVQTTNKIEKEINSCKNVKTGDYDKLLKSGNIEIKDYLTPYLENIKKFISPDIKKNNLKIVFDNLNGVGAIAIKPLFKELNINNLVIFNEEHDPYFRHRLPNPLEKNLVEAKEYLLTNKFDLAFGTDSDADRLGVIDDKGTYVSNNDILACLYYYLIKYKGEKGDIVKNCATSILVDEVAEKLGYKCYEVDVGFKNITNKMKEVDALIGGESSGGLTLRGYIHGKDSVFSSTLFLDMVNTMKKPVSEIVKEVYEFCGYKHCVIEDEIRYKKEDEEKIIKYLEQHQPTISKKLLKSDHFTRNYKYYFDNKSWMLLRMSGTEPAFRIFSEMESWEEAKKTINELKQFIEGIK